MKKYMLIVLILVLLIVNGCKMEPEQVTAQEVTPEITTAATPEPTPEPTPELTPLPTPEPKPELTPLPTPAPITTEAKLTTGGFEGNVYHNPYFEMTFTVPEEWSIVSKDAIAQIYGIGMELLGDISELDTDAYDSLESLEIVPLALVTQYPLHEPGSKASFTVMAQNMKLLSILVDDPSYFIDSTLKVFEESEMPYELIEQKSLSINGTTYAMMEGVLTVQDQRIHQRTYFTLCDHYVININMGYTNNKQLETLESIINSVTFD